MSCHVENEERPHVWLKEGSCCCVVVVAFFEGRDLFWRGAKQVCPTILGIILVLLFSFSWFYFLAVNFLWNFFHEKKNRVRESIKPCHKQCDKNPEILNICICIFHLCFSFVFFVCVLHLCLPFFHIDIFDCVSELYRFAFAPFICVLTHGLHLHLCLCCQRTLQKCRDQCMNVVYFDVCESLKPCHKQPEILNIYLCAFHLCFLFVLCICVCLFFFTFAFLILCLHKIVLHLRLLFVFWYTGCIYICACIVNARSKNTGTSQRTNVDYFAQQRC